MKRTTGGRRAHEYEHLTAADSDDALNRKLYAVDGIPGLWRRVKDPNVSDPASLGIIPAFCDSGIIYLRPADKEARELQEGGFFTWDGYDEDACLETENLVRAFRKHQSSESGGESLPLDGGWDESSAPSALETIAGQENRRAQEAAKAGCAFPNSPTCRGDAGATGAKNGHPGAAGKNTDADADRPGDSDGSDAPVGGEVEAGVTL